MVKAVDSLLPHLRFLYLRGGGAAIQGGTRNVLPCSMNDNNEGNNEYVHTPKILLFWLLLQQKTMLLLFLVHG